MGKLGDVMSNNVKGNQRKHPFVCMEMRGVITGHWMFLVVIYMD